MTSNWNQNTQLNLYLCLSLLLPCVWTKYLVSKQQKREFSWCFTVHSHTTARREWTLNAYNAIQCKWWLCVAMVTQCERERIRWLFVYTESQRQTGRKNNMKTHGFYFPFSVHIDYCIVDCRIVIVGTTHVVCQHVQSAVHTLSLVHNACSCVCVSIRRRFPLCGGFHRKCEYTQIKKKHSISASRVWVHSICLYTFFFFSLEIICIIFPFSYSIEMQ